MSVNLDVKWSRCSHNDIRIKLQNAEHAYYIHIVDMLYFLEE